MQTYWQTGMCAEVDGGLKRCGAVTYFTSNPSQAKTQNRRASQILLCALVKRLGSAFPEVWTSVASSERPLLDVANELASSFTSLHTSAVL